MTGHGEHDHVIVDIDDLDIAARRPQRAAVRSASRITPEIIADSSVSITPALRALRPTPS
jgi:hypothetical protein